MKSKTNKPVPKRNPLSSEEKELMMQVLIRNPSAFERAKDLLTTEHFGEDDSAYAAVWAAAKSFYEQYGEMPVQDFLQTEATSYIKEDTGLLIEDDVEVVEEVISKAFNPGWGDEIVTNEKWAQWTCNQMQLFMEESLARRLQEEIRSIKGRVTENMSELLEMAAAEASQIASVADHGGSKLFPEGWDIDGGINVCTTGIPFFDAFLAGGHAPGEVYGLLGPYGSAKTTLAVMLAVEAARRAHCQALAGSEDDEYVFLASYEAGVAELRLRALSYAAQIRRKSLEGMGEKGMKSLSTSKNLLPYEKSMFAAAVAEGQVVLGERGRANRAIKWLEEHLVVLDMTGADAGHASAGSGHVAEVSRRIAAELRHRGKNAKASLVIVDYVGAMAKRHLAATNKDESTLRHLIGGAPLAAKNTIAAKFGCPVWLLHQLSGAANQKGPAAQVYHTDAAGAKNFGENLDFVVVIGAVNGQGLCQINATKHRRTGQCPGVIVRVRGAMNRVEDTHNQYVVDQFSRCIVEKSLMHGVVNPKKHAS